MHRDSAEGAVGGLAMRTPRRAAPPTADASQPRTAAGPAAAEPRLDPAEAQAFTEQARWLHAYHDRRSDVLGQRAVTLLGFVSATVALLPAAFTLGKDAIRLTAPVKANVVVVLLLLVAATGSALRAIALRKAQVPSAQQLRDQWTGYGRGGARGLVHAQIAHAYLGTEPSEDMIAAASDEADSRALWFRCALLAASAAVAAAAVLAGQILFQQR